MRPVRQHIFACLGFALLFASADPMRSEAGRPHRSQAALVRGPQGWLRYRFRRIEPGFSLVFTQGFSTRTRAPTVSAGVRLISGWTRWGSLSPRRLFESWSRPARAILSMSFELEPGNGDTRWQSTTTLRRVNLPRDRLAVASGRMAMAFSPMNKPVSPAVRSFYQERLAAVKANPAPRPPRPKSCALSWAVSTRRWRREISRSFSSSRHRFAQRTAREASPPRESAFLFRRPGALRVALRRGEPDGCRASRCPGRRDLSRTLAQEFIAKAGSTAH